MAIKISADPIKKLKDTCWYPQQFLSYPKDAVTIYIVDPEAVDTRYTAQWKSIYPIAISNNTDEEIVVNVAEKHQATTTGAFPNFGGTNIYKSKQPEQIGEMSAMEKYKTAIILSSTTLNHSYKLRYMAEPLGVNIPLVACGMLVVMTPHFL